MAHNRIQNMLLGIAIGDAFGAGYEFLGKEDSRKVIAEQLDMTQYRAHPKSDPSDPRSHLPGKYTDDTQMSIAISELLLSGEGFSHENLARYFVECYKRDPILGYSSGFQQFLDSVTTGAEFLEKIRADSIKNGAAMRAVPLGILPDIEKVVEYAVLNAEITHNTPQGKASSVCVASASHYYLHEATSSSSVFDFVDIYCRKAHPESADHFQSIKDMDKLNPEVLFGQKNLSLGVTGEGMRTAGAMLYIVSRYGNDAFEALKQAVLLGGDVDSVAAISLGISASRNNLSGLPGFLLDNLTNEGYGKDYLLGLGENWYSKFGR